MSTMACAKVWLLFFFMSMTFKKNNNNIFMSIWVSFQFGDEQNSVVSVESACCSEKTWASYTGSHYIEFYANILESTCCSLKIVKTVSINTSFFSVVHCRMPLEPSEHYFYHKFDFSQFVPKVTVFFTRRHFNEWVGPTVEGGSSLWHCQHPPSSAQASVCKETAPSCGCIWEPKKRFGTK